MQKWYQKRSKRQPKKHLFWHFTTAKWVTKCIGKCDKYDITFDEKWISQNKTSINAQENSNFTENQKAQRENIYYGDAYRFLRLKRIKMIECVPQGQMVNEKYYIPILIKFKERLR